jgi:tRNA-dihydrouridine synthase A
MKAAVAIPVTVKCRIGIDEQDPESRWRPDARGDAAGADALIVHARKAWLTACRRRKTAKSRRSITTASIA